MIESFLSVGTQVLILFLMIGTGFVLGKLHLITHKGAVSMSNLLMYVVSPCILIVVFQRPLETETFHNFWVALLAAPVRRPEKEGAYSWQRHFSAPSFFISC